MHRVKGKVRLWLSIIILISISLKIALSVNAIWSYDFIMALQRSSIRYDALAGDPLPMLKLYHGLFTIWLKLPIEHGEYEGWIKNLAAFPHDFPSTLLIFILKLPILIFDIACGLAIYSITKIVSPTKEAKAFALWLLNPYVMLVTGLSGSVEVIPLFFLLACILLILKRRMTASTFPAVIGSALKLFPFFFFPAFLLRSGNKRNIVQTVSASLFGAGLYMLLLQRAGYDPLGSFLNYDPLTQLFLEIPLTPYATRIGLASLFTSLLYLSAFLWWKRSDRIEFDCVLAASLLLLAFTEWHPPYLLWAIPFLTVESAGSKRWFAYATAWTLSAFLFELMFFDLVTTQSLLYLPIRGQIMATLAEIVKAMQSISLLKMVGGPIIRSFFTALSLYLSLKIFWRNTECPILFRTRQTYYSPDPL